MAFSWTHTEQSLFPALAGERTAASIEARVYQTPALEAELGSEAWTALVSLDFRASDADLRLADLLAPFVNRARFETWRILELLRRVRSSPQDEGALEALYQLWCGCPDHVGRYGFLEPFGMAHLALLDRQHVSSSPAAEQLAEEAQRTADAIELGRIVITGEFQYAG